MTYCLHSGICMPSLTSTQQRCHHGGHATRVLPALAQSCGFAAESPGVAVLMRQRWAVDCSAPGHPCNTQGGMSDLISNYSSTIKVRLKPHRRHISRCVLALHPWMRPLLLPPSMDIYMRMRAGSAQLLNPANKSTFNAACFNAACITLLSLCH